VSLRLRRRRIGLRPRLLAALVATSIVTLGVAALALLPPLQDRLASQASADLESATDADTLGFQNAIARSLRASRGASREDRLSRLRVDLSERASQLRARTNARVIVTDSIIPADLPIADTDFAGSAIPENEILRATIDGLGQTIRIGNTVTVTRVMEVPPARGDTPPDHLFVLATQKQLTDVITAFDQVRKAFLAAAAVGLAVAFLLGIALSATLGRRLARLRDAANRVTEQGTDAPAPRDDGLDEVGELARALAGMQRELRRQEAARRAFVATASHELRTPLTSLQGTLELLQEDLHEGRLDHDDAERQVAGARVELRRLSRLANELLDLSRLDAAIPLREEPVELGELCRAVAAEFDLQAGEREVAMEVVPPPGPCWGRGDPSAVARVVRILLDNAVRYSPDDGSVRVVPAYHGEHATVEVCDEGPGVAPADRERIFERFERGATAPGEGGFGLGLAIGRELAQRMGGELGLDDGHAPGARFVLRLPIEMPAGSHPEPVPAPVA
jgi:signal transduction histidine kinase